MAIEVREITNLLQVDVSKLVQESEKEGYRFVSRLVSEYEDGTNRFDGEGEALYGAFDGDKLVAVGGLNRHPLDDSTARLHRFYTLPEYRRKGIGSQLFQIISDNAKENFTEITTKTESAKADAFYRAVGFIFDGRSADTTHVIGL